MVVESEWLEKVMVEKAHINGYWMGGWRCVITYAENHSHRANLTLLCPARFCSVTARERRLRGHGDDLVRGRSYAEIA